MAIIGNVPLGGGLSSSASLEVKTGAHSQSCAAHSVFMLFMLRSWCQVATATLLDSLLGIMSTGAQKTKICVGAEHDYAGEFASAAMLLHCVAAGDLAAHCWTQLSLSLLAFGCGAGVPCGIMDQFISSSAAKVGQPPLGSPFSMA